MTKDSPNAASLALRSICSAFSRCISRVSDIECKTGFSGRYKMRRIVPSKPRYGWSLKPYNDPGLSKSGGICEGLLALLYPAARGDTEPSADIKTGIAKPPRLQCLDYLCPSSWPSPTSTLLLRRRIFQRRLHRSPVPSDGCGFRLAGFQRLPSGSFERRVTGYPCGFSFLYCVSASAVMQMVPRMPASATGTAS